MIGINIAVVDVLEVTSVIKIVNRATTVLAVLCSGICSHRLGFVVGMDIR